MKRTAAKIRREYGPFPGVNDVGGVSFDGQRIWMATGASLQAVDPDSGAILGDLDILAEAGTAFDGENLYQITGSTIVKIDPGTGAGLTTIPAPDAAGDNSGLAWAEGSLWVGQHRGGKIHQVDPSNGVVLRTIESDRFVTGVTWVDGELWHGTWQDGRSDVRRIDAQSGEVLERIEMPAGTGVSGLESDGREQFFCGGGGSGKVLVIERPRQTE